MCSCVCMPFDVARNSLPVRHYVRLTTFTYHIQLIGKDRRVNTVKLNLIDGQGVSRLLLYGIYVSTTRM